MTSTFRNEQAKDRMKEWYERFRSRIPGSTESRRVTTRFGETHVLVGGPPLAPSVVVLHGALSSSAHVLRELAGLLEDFRVYAVDIVGQSVQSADARPSVTDNAYGAWLQEVLDGLGLTRTHVVGVSWGGFVAIRLGAIAPQRIDRLVLLVPAGVVTGPAWEGLTQLAWPMLLYRLAPSRPRLEAFLRGLLTTMDDEWAPYLGDAVRSFNMDIRVPALARPEELRGLAAPTLVVGADRDLSFPGAKLLARAAQLFPGLVDQDLLADSRHCPPTTDAFRTWLSARIRNFLLHSTREEPAPQN